MSEPFVIERTYNAKIEKVWNAITDKDQMKQWYFDLKEFKPEVGFEFEFQGGPDGRTYLHLCKVTEVITGRKITYSWRYDGYEGNSFVTWELFPEGEKTRLKLTHAGLETFPVSNPDLAKGNFEEGWKDIVGNQLTMFVESGTISKSVEIDAPQETVWKMLTESENTKAWVSSFGEGTYVETDWNEGSEVTWKDGNGDVGAKGRIVKNDGTSELKINYFDNIEADITSDTGEYSEHFKINNIGEKSLLTIEAGKLPLKYVEQHEPLWEKAIERLKQLAETGK